MATAREVFHSSESAECYTPAPIMEAARQVMGRIDLDPASKPTANKTVGATRFYDRDENGLSMPWRGRVWLNPNLVSKQRPLVRTEPRARSILGTDNQT